MNRRQILTLLGAAAWPYVARGQGAVRKIGYLAAGSQSAFATRVVAFKEGLGAQGFIDGRDVAIDYRFVDGQYDRLQAAAADLVAQQVDVIVTLGPPSLRAAKAATTTTPIVFVIGSDPVRDGLVASMARPGGNATGISFLAVDLTPKRLELVSELVPKAKRIALFFNPTNAAEERVAVEVQEAAQRRRFQFQPLRAASPSDIDAGFATLAPQRDTVLIVSPDSFFTTNAERLIALAVRHAVPTIYAFREIVAAGGLASYAPSVPPLHRQSGVYAGRILKGEKAGELPVMQPTNFELVINLKTAQALGLDVPPTLLARADGVIE